MTKRALITGISGQDGAYLARLLLDQGYEVTGALRHTSSANLARLAELGADRDVALLDIDLLEFSNILRVLERARPDEVYNLAAQSFVGLSFEQPIYTADINALGVSRLLEAVRTVNPKIRYYQASTSEMFGKVASPTQSEETPFYPRSPYGVAKLFGHWATVNSREAYGIHACSGILFNHESPLRGQRFVSRRITLELARVKHGQAEGLALGNLDAQRDWGFAGDYVRGMWSMLQHAPAGDYVLATGQTHKVRDFVRSAGAHFGFDIVWEGSGLEERGVDRVSGRTIVTINPNHFRPSEVDVLTGNAAKATRELGWRPSVDFEGLVAMMAEADDKRVRDQRVPF